MYNDRQIDFDEAEKIWRMAGQALVYKDGIIDLVSLGSISPRGILRAIEGGRFGAVVPVNR